MRAFRIVAADFFYLLPFSRYKGPKRTKMRFWGLHKIFIFHPILMGFFSLDFSQRELSELLQPIFSISYRFWDTRGQRGQKCDFGAYIKFSFFIWFGCDVFSLDFSQWELSEFLQERHIKLIFQFSSNFDLYQTLLYQTHYCDKQVLEAYLFLLFCC